MKLTRFKRILCPVLAVLFLAVCIFSIVDIKPRQSAKNEVVANAEVVAPAGENNSDYFTTVEDSTDGTDYSVFFFPSVLFNSSILPFTLTVGFTVDYNSYLDAYHYGNKICIVTTATMGNISNVSFYTPTSSIQHIALYNPSPTYYSTIQMSLDGVSIEKLNNNNFDIRLTSVFNDLSRVTSYSFFEAGNITTRLFGIDVSPAASVSGGVSATCENVYISGTLIGTSFVKRMYLASSPGGNTIINGYTEEQYQAYGNDRYNAGYQAGEEKGFKDGVASDSTAFDYFTQIVRAPIEAVMSMLDVDFMGWNLKGFFSLLVCGAIIMLVIKLVL